PRRPGRPPAGSRRRVRWRPAMRPLARFPASEGSCLTGQSGASVQTPGTTIPPLDQPLEDGWTLPASWYTDTVVQERERERVFAHAWTYAGPGEWVEEAGSYFAARIGHVPVAIVRGKDGVLRGLVNVCRHRGHL